MYNLSFEKLTIYNIDKPGITVNVSVRLSDLFSDFKAKIDTGAEACIFQRQIGENLELEIEKGEEQVFSTVTDNFLTYGHWVTLIVEDIEVDSYVFFAESEYFNRNVLGRHGWLDRVIIGINDYDGKLFLSKYE